MKKNSSKTLTMEQRSIIPEVKTRHYYLDNSSRFYLQPHLKKPMREIVANNMKELETNDIRLLAFFIFDVMEQLEISFSNKLFIKATRSLSMQGSELEFIAILEHIVNPNAGKFPFFCENLLITVSTELRDGKFTICASQRIFDNQCVAQILKKIIRDYEEKEGLCFLTFEFKSF